MQIRGPLLKQLVRATITPAQAASTPFVVYGLGNHPFPETKHSLGQLLLASLADHATAISRNNEDARAQFAMNRQYNAWTAEVSLTKEQTGHEDDIKLLFVKSKALMNLSGGTVNSLCKTYPHLVPSGRLLVLHDDLSILPCTARGRFSGTPKGHNGLRDITRVLRTEEYHRLRIGIGRPEPESRMSIADWCLAPVSREEKLAVQKGGVVFNTAWQYLLDAVVKPKEASEAMALDKIPNSAL